MGDGEREQEKIKQINHKQIHGDEQKNENLLR